jgi:hypothetical protein
MDSIIEKSRKINKNFTENIIEFYRENQSYFDNFDSINEIETIEEIILIKQKYCEALESDYKVNLYDLRGNLVKNIANKKMAGQQKIAVNIENIPVGNYLLIISTNNGYVSKKLIIQR